MLSCLSPAAEGSTGGVGLIVSVVGNGGSGVKAPLGLQRLLDLLRCAELEVADLLGDDGALGLGVELGDELGLETASLLGVQVTNFLGDIKERRDDLIVALFGSFIGRASSTANFDGEFFTSGVSDILAGLLLDVAGGAARFVDGTALLGARSVADLL